MARALENPVGEPTYLEFFGLTRSPFARLPNTSEIFNTEQYSLLMSHLANAAEQTDRRVVICGADGSGKTSLLKRYASTLGDDASCASIDQTCIDEMQFYTAFLRQLGFDDITGSTHELRSITRKFLIHRCMAEDPVLLIIDNAHLLTPPVFEQLRWISEIKVEGRRVLSVVLAGNSDLMRIIESPAMDAIKFRSHVDFYIRVYTEEETTAYVRHRLKLAGRVDAVMFSKEARPLVYRYTGGIPGLINTLCNALLTEAHAQNSHVISADLIRTVADSSQLMPHVVPLRGKGRRSTDLERKMLTPDADVENLLEQVTDLREQLDAQTKETTKLKRDYESLRSSAAITTFEIVKNRKTERFIKVTDLPPRIMIGRGEDSELCLASKFVSRHHALMFRNGDEFYLEDLNSFNGTLVNFKTITRCRLRPDDNIIIGDYQIRPRA